MKKEQHLAPIVSLRPASTESVSKGGFFCWFLLGMDRDHRPGKQTTFRAVCLMSVLFLVIN
jgi:hypothetical protein